MAPEVIMGQRYSYPADIWSVGATVVEMLEGIPPYGDFPVMRAIVEIGNAGWAGFRRDTVCSAELRELVGMCMVPAPGGRADLGQLLMHPFVRRAPDLDRQAVLAPLLNKEIDFEQLLQGSAPKKPAEEPRKPPPDERHVVFADIPPPAEPDPEPAPQESAAEEEPPPPEWRLDPGYANAIIAAACAGLFALAYLVARASGPGGLGALAVVALGLAVLVTGKREYADTFRKWM
jgi:serine/threonine protein kinase